MELDLTNFCYIYLMNEYNGDWRPNWEDSSQQKFTIIVRKKSILKSNAYSFLAFKSDRLREEFMKNFEDLILKVSPLDPQ